MSKRLSRKLSKRQRYGPLKLVRFNRSAGTALTLTRLRSISHVRRSRRERPRLSGLPSSHHRNAVLQLPTRTCCQLPESLRLHQSLLHHQRRRVGGQSTSSFTRRKRLSLANSSLHSAKTCATGSFLLKSKINLPSSMREVEQRRLPELLPLLQDLLRLR